MQADKSAIAGIADDAWTPIAYTIGGDAEVAGTALGDRHRLVVRRTRIVGAHLNCSPTGVTTDSPDTTVDADAEHPPHAVIELAIREPEGWPQVGALPVGAVPRQRRPGDVWRAWLAAA